MSAAHPVHVSLRLFGRCSSALACLLVAGAAMAAQASAVPLYRGANVHSLWTWSVSEMQMDQELDALARAGANSVRVDVTWSALEPEPGQYSPSYLSRMDEFFAAAQALGLKVVATVAATPSWASAGGAWYDAPSDPSTFGQVAQFITSRYGPDLAAVEAWNEPNHPGNLVAPDGDLAGTYAAMLKAFYSGAKAGDPNVPVLAGALAYADVPFLQQLYADGIQGHYDGLSVHPYADGAAPSNTTVTHSFIGQIQALHSAQLAAGDHTPIWVTEFGWPVGTSAGANTEAQQADYVQQAFQLVNSYSYVQAALVYQLRDMATDPANPEDNFGLLTEDFTPRPAYAAFTAAMSADQTLSTGAAATSTGTGAGTQTTTAGTGSTTAGTPPTSGSGRSHPSPRSSPRRAHAALERARRSARNATRHHRRRHHRRHRRHRRHLHRHG
jgi:hypothetical protein